MPSLSEEEQQRLAKELRDQLEEQFAASQERRARHKLDASSRQSRREEVKREVEVRALKEKVTEQFWHDKGYVRYVNLRGQASWLPEAEAEKRLRRRRRRKKRPVEARDVVITLVLLAVAVIVGLVLGAG